jgi:hypothetical protein
MFWTTLQNQLSGGAGIVLAMHWQGGIKPGGNYDTPDEYNPSDFHPDSALGHAVTMVGYDLRAATPGNPLLDVHDPANNPLVAAPVRSHVWPPVVADSYTVTVNPTDISIVVGAATGVIYGAVITTPEPASWALLSSGLLALGGLAALRRRRQAGT